MRAPAPIEVLVLAVVAGSRPGCLQARHDGPKLGQQSPPAPSTAVPDFEISFEISSVPGHDLIARSPRLAPFLRHSLRWNSPGGRGSHDASPGFRAANVRID